ncbi:hypothetical protein OAT67_00795 [Bacteriovoracaceae bacterium]|nr:hypothetical protein [Bacteriovoracaceae bacterium]
MTCGSPFECFGGLLIRGIKNLETKEEVNGCAKVLNHLISGKENTKLISKKWNQDELIALTELDDSNIFDCQVFQLIPNDSQVRQTHIFIGTREHGQKVEKSIEQNYSSYSLKAISSLSIKSSKRKYQKIEFSKPCKKAS